MPTEHTLLMQKTIAGSAVKSSLEDFGFAVCDIDWPDEETQEVATRTWPGLDGEDVFVPPAGLKFQAYDLSVTLSYKGEVHSAEASRVALRDYLSGAKGDGSQLAVYDPFHGKGRTMVHLKKIADLSLYRSDVDEVMKIKVVLRVTDPITEIKLDYVGD